MHLNCANFSDFGANRRLNLSVLWGIHLDIYAFWWLTVLCSIVELFSCLRWKTDRKVLSNFNLSDLSYILSIFFITTLRGNNPYQRTAWTLRVNGIIFFLWLDFFFFLMFFANALSVWLAFSHIYFNET